MKFGLIFTGFIFFLNFNVGIVDFLPDFIGCLLILAGLSKLRDIDGRFDYAFRLTSYMTGFFAVKAVVSLVQQNYTLPFTFISSVVETIYLIFLFTNIFGAIEYTAQRHGGTFLEGYVPVRIKDKKTGKVTTVQKHVSFSNNASIMAFIFSIAKGVLVFIPESIELMTHTDELDLSYNASRFSAAIAKPPVMLFCYLVITIAAICFVIIVGSYFRKIRADKAYISSLCEMYDRDVRPNVKMFITRSLVVINALIVIALLTLPDFKIEYFNVLPNVISYVLLIFAFVMISKYADTSRIPCIVSLAMASCVSVFNTWYLFTNESTLRFKGTVEVLSAGEAVADGSACIVTLIGNAIELALFVIAMVYLAMTFKKVKALRHESAIKCSIAPIVVASFLYAVSYCADNFLVLYKPYVAINTTGLITDANDFIHLVAKAISIISIIVMIHGFYKLKEWVSLYI